MFEINDYVSYGVHGVCRIINKEVKVLNKKRVEYYVLEPLGQSGARFYIPVNNEVASGKLHTLITSDELQKLLSRDVLDGCNWITDENTRKQHYKDILSSSDRKALMRTVHSLCKYKEQLELAGKKFHICDENFLRDAKRLLDSEFSIVLGIPQSEVSAYVQNILNTD